MPAFMTKENLHAMIGWSCAVLVFSMYILVPLVELISSINVASRTFMGAAFLSAIFMDAAKPVRETEYRCFKLDAWLPMVAWICAFAFSWIFVGRLIFYPLLKISGFEELAEEISVYSETKMYVLIILMLKAGFHQVVGKSLPDNMLDVNMLDAILSKFIIRD